jgi:hypothetical protein
MAEPHELLRTRRLIGLTLGGVFAFLIGGPAGILAFFAIVLIAAVFSLGR